MTSQNILCKRIIFSVCACVLCTSHFMQGHCLAVQEQCLQPGACAGAKRVCWHTMKKYPHTNTHSTNRHKEQKKNKLIKTQTETSTHKRAHTPLRSWSIHDKSKSPPDVRQSNQRAWCSYKGSQEPGGDKQWCESSTTTQWPQHSLGLWECRGRVIWERTAASMLRLYVHLHPLWYYTLYELIARKLKKKERPGV